MGTLEGPADAAPSVIPLGGDADATLSPLTPGDAAHLSRVIVADRASFDPWLRWSAAIDSPESAERFIEGFVERERLGSGFHWGLRKGPTLLGGAVCWSIDADHRVAELGYWLVPSARGRGLATASMRRVVAHLFEQRGLNRIEFQCRVENAPSRRVAERVGARLEGARRQSHFVGGTYRDHAVYAVIADEWRGRAPRPEDP